MPGFRLSLGFTLFYLVLIVLIPLSAVFLKTLTMSWGDFISAVTSPRVIASYRLTFGTALLAALLLNAVFGSIVAWVLVRYTFPGKRLVDALVDLPFTLPTAVAGIALTSIGLPFLVGTVQPVLEEAAASLGANHWQTFTRVIFSTVFPALLPCVALSFARATGEYVSVIFIVGNMPLVSEITSLFIIMKLEQYD